MWNVPSEERLSRIPGLYKTEGASLQDKIIYLHFFIGNCDWYVAEYDGEDIFFGYVILNGDDQNSEWGYFSFAELRDIKINGIEIDCELEEHWPPTPVAQIPKIKYQET